MAALVLQFPSALKSVGVESYGRTNATPFASADTLAELNLPDSFLSTVQRRAIIDSYSARAYRAEKEIPIAVLRNLPTGRSSEPAIRSVVPQTSESILRYRQGLEAPVKPLRGYRAPILDEAGELWPATLQMGEFTAKEREAAELIRKSLTFDGILVTLSRAIEVLGAEPCASDPTHAARQLQCIGFPVDLLAGFQIRSGSVTAPTNVISVVAQRLIASGRAEGLRAGLKSVPFVFSRTHEGFRAAVETGETEIGLIRLQIGSGFDGGVIRGGIIDVAGQLVSALPQSDFLAVTSDSYFENIRRLALGGWRLRRPGSLTLVREPGPVRAWAQDNGKAGTITDKASGKQVPATLAPRYASQDEVNSPLFAGESFLMDALRTAGHPVVHSPLLFQGGNLMIVRDPVRNERMLLMSETELYRNTALGLTRDQAVEAFRIEFAVDHCVVLPAVSYHLDYDMTVRLHEGKLFVFVNDTHAGAKLVVQRGVSALRGGGKVQDQESQEMEAALNSNDTARLLRLMTRVLNRCKNDRGEFNVSIAALFSTEPTDPAVFNFQCFLTALDLLAALAPKTESVPGESTRERYLTALRESLVVAEKQREVLASFGWKIVAIPSMPDLDHSLNYLNGLHDRTRFLMPAMGGFYSPVDEAAVRAFREVLGPKVSIVRIFNPEAQQKHGGVHCVASAYPRADAN